MSNRIQWWRTILGEDEIRSVTEAMAQECFSQGPLVTRFEQEISTYLGIPYVIATTSGTMAMVMALMALEIGPGDEVIVPNRTFVATAHAAMMLGARIALVDTRSDLPLIDVDQIRSKITSATRAIMPVHLNGRIADMEGILEIAEEYDLHVVEDSSQAFGSRRGSDRAGTFGHVGTFSFGMAKLVSTGQGGVAVTSDPALYERMRLVQNHGVELGKTHESDYNVLGGNFKFTDIQAAIGIAQLNRLQQKIERVTEIYHRYLGALEGLSQLEVLTVDLECGEIPLWTEVLCADRENVMAFLADRDIGTDRFLPNLNLSPHLRNAGQFPNSIVFHDQGFALPCGPGQPLENVDRVIETLKSYG